MNTCKNLQTYIYDAKGRGATEMTMPIAMVQNILDHIQSDEVKLLQLRDMLHLLAYGRSSAAGLPNSTIDRSGNITSQGATTHIAQTPPENSGESGDIAGGLRQGAHIAPEES